MFERNVLLDLSVRAAFSSLQAKLVLQILSQSARAVAIWVIRGDKGVGDIPVLQ